MPESQRKRISRAAPIEERPFNGKFLARISPERHRELAIWADLQKVSINLLLNVLLDSPEAENICLSITEEHKKQYSLGLTRT